MPPANTSMTKSSKSPVSSSRQDQVLAGLLPEPLRLAIAPVICGVDLLIYGGQHLYVADGGERAHWQSIAVI